MYDNNQATDLAGFLFESTAAVCSFPYLFHIARAGCNYCGQDYMIDRDSSYPFYTIHFLLDGCGFFHIDGQDYLLKKGDAFIITPKFAHLYSASPDSSLLLLWVEFSGSFCKELFSSFLLNRIHVLRDNTSSKAEQSLIELLDSLMKDASCNEFEMSAKLYQMMMYLIESAELASHTQLQLPGIISSALDYIGENFTQPIRIAELAERLHISHTYLTKLFRQYVGTTPLKYITLKKMEYACFLLKSTQLSCEEISEKTGMYDNAYFCRTFKSVKGLTPAKYKRQS